jgi:heat shock protein HslJ
MKPYGLLILLLCVTVTSCDDDNPTGPSSIMEVTWKLQTIELAGSAAITVPNPDEYTLRLEDDGRANVRADCNTCSGSYTLNGSALSFSNMACTLIACAPPSLDTNYAQALQNVRTATVDGSQLVVTGTGFTLRFRQ